MEAPPEVVPSIETPIDKNDDPATSKPALTPPTSEDMDKRERMSSELTELDSDDDDEEIEPDHYFEGGKIPVFKPTMDQFRSFKKFINKIDKYGMKSGIVKVIPPKEWRDSLPDLSEAVKTIKVKNPIMQEFAGQHGIYTQANIEKQRSYNLPEWRALTDEAHHQPPARRGERRKAAAEAPSRTRSTRAQAAAQPADSHAHKRKPGRPRKQNLKMEDDDDADVDDSIEVPPTPKSPGKEEPKVDKKSRRAKVKKEELDDSPSKPKGRQPRSTASRRMNNRSETANYVDEAAFEDFDYHLPNLDEYSVERCKELEDNYWKTINYGQPMYGADMPGSLFDDRTTSWNVAKLENLLDVLGTKVPGVNTAYLYLGMWKATFAWHLEDVDLYSINYIHFGAPKQWYSISQEDARRFEAAMKTIWPRDAKNCSQFLRHKTYLISPSQLEKQFNIKVNRLVHYEGEFVITYPYGYHSGYNLGYNCAESVNFANESWLNYGRIAKKCECESDSVWVDVNEIERKLRGEPTPEYYEETDSEEEEEQDHLPSPPPSVAGKSKGKAGRKPKRKRDEAESKEAPKRKKMKRIRIRIKIPGRGMPCVLCPNDVDYDDLLPTDNGLKAHRLCAEFTPETYIATKPTEKVCNVANVGKERLELKCNYCRSKRGAKFQCSAKKCARAFHATCAAAAGVQVDCGPMPTFDEEGTEFYYDGYDFRCRFHRPKKRHAKTVDGDTLEKDKLIFKYAATLKSKDVVQFQYLASDQVYGGMVVENRPGEWTILVDVLPDGDRVEVEWKYLLQLDPEESQRPKPSSNAKPLPEHLQDNDPSLNITNRTDGVPQIGDPFQDPNSEQKWAEFHTAPEVTQKVAKVDVKEPERLWYYLGKTSTEARPQYTENLAKTTHNPKSNFLDTVKPAPPQLAPVASRSYPAAYPIKPSPVSIPPRTPMQSQIRPTEKPYQYKPKETTTYRSPVSGSYHADPWKNPHSPVAHQPNVVYDYRATAPQYGYPSGNAYHHRPSQSYGQYAPTASYPSGPSSNGVDQYGRPTTGHSHPLPPYPYYPTTSQSAARQLPAFHHYRPPGQASSQAPPKTPTQRPEHSPSAPQALASQSQVPPRGTAPISGMLSTTGATKPSIPTGGCNPEWIAKMGSKPPPSTAPGPPPSSHGSMQSGGTPTSYGRTIAPIPALPLPRPTFQTADAFQRDMSRAPPSSTGMAKWESMMKRLNSTTSSSDNDLAATASPPSNVPAIPTRQPSLPHETSKSATPAPQTPYTPHSTAPVPLAGSTELQRPIPSPISDTRKSPQRPEYSPISDDGKGSTKPSLPPLPQITSGETWRYS